MVPTPEFRNAPKADLARSKYKKREYMHIYIYISSVVRIWDEESYCICYIRGPYKVCACTTHANTYVRLFMLKHVCERAELASEKPVFVWSSYR